MNVRLKHVLLVAGIAASLFGLHAVFNHRVHAATTSATAAQFAPRAAIELVRREPVSNRLSVAGEFLPYQEVQLHGKVAGYLRKINVDIGDRVRAGQVLADLEVPELNAQVEGADAGVRHSQDEIRRAQHAVERAEAAHAALHSGAVRLQQASEARPGLIAQQELDDAMAKDASSEAQVEGAKAALSAAEQQLDVSKATHTQVSAMQDYSRIVAPFDGVITWRYADTGALIQAGTSNSNSMPVLKLAQISTLRLRIPVPEEIAPRVHIGDEVDIRVQATGEHFPGNVTRFTGSLDRATRTMQVEIDVPNQDYRLAPGMYADVSLEVEKRTDGVTVPVQAVTQNGDSHSVLLVDAQNRVEPREIRTGIENADRVEVLAGLQEGDRVIVGNLAAYQAGEVVAPKPSSIAQVEPGRTGSH